MGNGLSKEREYQLVYSMLHKIQRELDKAGVASVYKNRALSGREWGGGFFSVTYNRLNASNGESCLFPQVSIKWGAKWQHYADFSQDCEPYKTGFSRIVELFAPKSGPSFPQPGLDNDF